MAIANIALFRTNTIIWSNGRVMTNLFAIHFSTICITTLKGFTKNWVQGFQESTIYIEIGKSSCDNELHTLDRRVGLSSPGEVDWEKASTATDSFNSRLGYWTLNREWNTSQIQITWKQFLANFLQDVFTYRTDCTNHFCIGTLFAAFFICKIATRLIIVLHIYLQILLKLLNLFLRHIGVRNLCIYKIL